MNRLIKANLVYPVIGEPVKGGGVVVRDGIIDNVGKVDKMDAGAFDDVIDLSGYLIMPGFVNGHSHLQWSAAKGKTMRGAPFTDWIKSIVMARDEITETERLSATRRGIEEMLLSGVTTVADVVSEADFARPLLDSDMRSVILIEPIAPHEKDAEQTGLFVRSQIEKLLKIGATAGIAPHSPYTVSPKLFIMLRKLSDQMKLPFSVHLAETSEEDMYVRKGSGGLEQLLKLSGFIPKGYNGRGKSPVAWLESLGVLQGCLAVHLNAVDDNDILLLAKENAAPVFCPQSSKWFEREKVMPLESLMDAGLRPAIGTDSLASNDSLSMLDELRCATEYFPDIRREALIEAATINGARHLSLNCGSIEKGRLADIIGFRWDGSQNPVDTIFAAEKAEFVMINGRPLRRPDGIKYWGWRQSRGAC
ncbi:MAG: amidohydrolase family protein [Nitrospinota bacterium]